ncbi:MAG: VOC family protein [Myxococcota bacterium]|nr:VOC family protein [Myxococcota bacterium]
MLETLDHVIVAVRDLEAATGRMARLLGRTPSWRGEHPGEGTANTLFRLDNTYLELLAPLGDGAAGRALQAWLSRRGEGIAGVAFGTPDAEACHRQFGEAQLEPGPVSPGMGRDVESGAYREWQRFDIPPQRTRGVFLFAIEHQSPADILPPAGQLAEEAATVSGLDHVVVRTADPEAAIRLYGESLGLRLALDRSFPKWGSRMLFFRVGGVTVEVVASLDPSEEEADGDRLWGLCWRVPDASRARKRMSAAGFDVSDVRDGRKPGTRVFTVRDGSCGVPTLMIEPVIGR